MAIIFLCARSHWPHSGSLGSRPKAILKFWWTFMNSFLASLSHLSTWWLSMLNQHTGLHLKHHKSQAMSWEYGNRVSTGDLWGHGKLDIQYSPSSKATERHWTGIDIPDRMTCNDSNWLSSIVTTWDNLMLKEEHLEKGERRKKQRTIKKYKAWLSLNVVRTRTLTFLYPGPPLRRHCLWMFQANGLSAGRLPACRGLRTDNSHSGW